jgi:predicted MarR family transcription regulator
LPSRKIIPVCFKYKKRALQDLCLMVQKGDINRLRTVYSIKYCKKGASLRTERASAFLNVKHAASFRHVSMTMSV